MNIKSCVKLISSFLLVYLFASCTQSSVYEMIPADAQFALRIDVRSILEKSLGEENRDSKIVLNELKESCDYLESDDLAKIVKGIIDDPRMSGINLTAPAVISGKLDLEDEEVELYIALSLGDSKKFKDFVYALYEEAKEYCGTYYEGGPSRFTLSDNAEGFYFGDFLGEDLCLGVTNDFAVFYCSSEGLGEKLKVGKKALRNLFEQESKCDAAGIKDFEKMSGDISLWMNGEKLTRDALRAFKYDLDFLYKHLIAHSEWYEDSYYLMNLDFEKGKNIYEMTIGGSKELMAEFSKYSSTSSSKYFKYLPKDALAVVNFKLSQELLVDAWEGLSSLSEFEEVLEVLESEYGIDEKTIKGFPGIISAAVSASSISESPSFVVTAECDKKVYDVLVNILEEELGFEKEGSAYVYETWTSAYYITYVDGAIMFMDNKIWQRSNGKALKESFSNNSLSSDIAKGGVLFDLSSLSKDDLDDLADDEFDMEGQDLLQIMSSLTVTYDKSSAKFVWNMGDKDSNLLQKLVALIAENI